MPHIALYANPYMFTPHCNQCNQYNYMFAQVTGAVLPQEVLPARVSKLCEEVGLPCSERPSWEEMAQLVKTVGDQVGVAL
jgi:hypothetical protein